LGTEVEGEYDERPFFFSKEGELLGLSFNFDKRQPREDSKAPCSDFFGFATTLGVCPLKPYVD
jgi:hypothetical protein